MKPARLSPTGALKYETCPRQYLLEDVRKIRPAHRPANLAFGGVLHLVVEEWIKGWMAGKPFDPAAMFDREWRAAREAEGVEYSASQSPETLGATGRALAARFAERWPGFGRLPALDRHGEPLIERKLEARVGPDLVVVGKPDLVVFDPEGRLEVLDLKTPAAPADPAWLALADQLTAYQVLLDAHAERLGLPRVERLGLLELVKRKVTPKGQGPEVRAPVSVDRRSPEAVGEYLAKLRGIAGDLRRGRFPRRSLMAHNSPCGLCAVEGYCRAGDAEGLIVPEAEPGAARAA
ncbi:MAG: PD-(D/E)XK nuclease family protein [bacterium]|nr:PD-(D/E)XK nuclease family protein [bacterium]